MTAGAKPHLVAIDQQGKVSAYQIRPEGGWLVPVASHLDIGGPWDIVAPLVLGNQPYLLTYASQPGQFAFSPVGADLTNGPPFRYSRAHAPGVTTGFSVAQPIVVGGSVYYLCYGIDSGRVLIYSLSVTASSTDGAPLASLPVWEHQWARQWTRFAFFQLGGGAFFLKTNIGRLNVNIDHVRDDPAQGTAEVGTHLVLEDALALDMVRPFRLRGAAPYFLTYKKDGTATFNRIHGDCKGWTTEARLQAPAAATHIVPLQLGEECYVLFA